MCSTSKGRNSEVHSLSSDDAIRVDDPAPVTNDTMFAARRSWPLCGTVG